MKNAILASYYFSALILKHEYRHITNHQRKQSLLFKGLMNEFSKFDMLYDFDESELILNLKDVSRINSIGVREWLHALSAIAPQIQVVFEACSPMVVYQMNMIPFFVQRISVKSVYAPYYCEEDDEQQLFLIDIEDYKQTEQLPSFQCPTHQISYLFDDDPESFFYFIELAKMR